MPNKVLLSLFNDTFTDLMMLNDDCKTFSKEKFILFWKKSGFSDERTNEFKRSPWVFTATTH